MKISLTILFLFCFNAYSQSYTLKWNSGGHTIYTIQKSVDNVIWNTINTVSAKVNDTSFSYTIPLPVKFNYYRIIADGLVSKSIYVNNILPIINISQTNIHIKLQSQ